jgi:hypothetical protein
MGRGTLSFARAVFARGENVESKARGDHLVKSKVATSVLCAPSSHPLSHKRMQEPEQD